MKKKALILTIFIIVMILLSCGCEKTVTFPTVSMTMDGNELQSYNILISSKNGAITSEGDGNKSTVDELIKTNWESFPNNSAECIKNLAVHFSETKEFVGEAYVEGVYQTDGERLNGGESTETSLIDFDLPDDFKEGQNYILCIKTHIVTNDNKAFKDEYYFIRLVSTDYHKTEEEILVDWSMFVRCNGKIYQQADGQFVPTENLGDELGSVITNIPSKFTSSVDYQAALVADFASPVLPVGTKLYAIKDSIDIAAEIDGQYILFTYDKDLND